MFYQTVRLFHTKSSTKTPVNETPNKKHNKDNKRNILKLIILFDVTQG